MYNSKYDVLVVPKELGKWLDRSKTVFGNKNIVFALIEEFFKSYTYCDFSSDTNKFISYNKKEIIEILIGIREYKIEEDEFYALIKGWEKVYGDFKYWNYSIKYDCVFPYVLLDYTGNHKVKMTRSEWNEVGINSLNADFSDVKK